MRDGDEIVRLTWCPENNVRKGQIGEELAFPGDLDQPRPIPLIEESMCEDGVAGIDHPFSVMRAPPSRGREGA